MSRIIYQNSVGGVSIVVPKSGTASTTLATRVVPSGTSYEIVADSAIPTDTTFRDAWRKSGSTIDINLAAAKEVALAEIKERALKAINSSNEATALGDTPVHTASAIQSAYATAKSAVNADTTVANIKAEMLTFFSTYDPATPTTTYAVTVAAKTSGHAYYNQGSSSGYFLDGTESPALTVTAGQVIKFDQSDSTNAAHPIAFFADAAKTTPFTTLVTSYGTSGNAGAYVQLQVTVDTPTTLYYMCTSHAYMGNSITKS